LKGIVIHEGLKIKPYIYVSPKGLVIKPNIMGNSMAAQKSHSDASDVVREASIKEEVWAELDKNPLLTPRQLCGIVGLAYKIYRRYVTQLRYLWKKSSRLGVGSKSPKLHKVRAFCYAPTSLDRKDDSEVTERAVEAGWVLSKNRNRVLIWKTNPTYGRIEWWETGNILVSIKKPQHMGRVKQLLCLAFFETGLIFDSKVLSAFLSDVRWYGSHDAYETSERLPYMAIDWYVKSHGIRIVLGDASHPHAVEVQWVYPDWLERLELLQQHNVQVLEDFSKFMKNLSQSKRRSLAADRMVI